MKATSGWASTTRRSRQVAESAERIDPDTVFHIYGDLIFVNSPSKSVLVLKVADLSKVRELALQ